MELEIKSSLSLSFSQTDPFSLKQPCFLSQPQVLLVGDTKTLSGTSLHCGRREHYPLMKETSDSTYGASDDCGQKTSHSSRGKQNVIFNILFGAFILQNPKALGTQRQQLSYRSSLPADFINWKSLPAISWMRVQAGHRCQSFQQVFTRCLLRT